MPQSICGWVICGYYPGIPHTPSLENLSSRATLHPMWAPGLACLRKIVLYRAGGVFDPGTEPAMAERRATPLQLHKSLNKVSTKWSCESSIPDFSRIVPHVCCPGHGVWPDNARTHKPPPHRLTPPLRFSGLGHWPVVARIGCVSHRVGRGDTAPCCDRRRSAAEALCKTHIHAYRHASGGQKRY